MIHSRKFVSLVLALFLTVSPLAAHAGESLVNSDIDVDVTGKDAADAREQAMMKAHTDALGELLSKFTTPDQVTAIINNLGPTKINGLVRGTEVLDEKISSNRYRARLMVTFDADEISNLIGKNGTGTNLEQAPNVVGSFLIIPAYEEDGVQMLWEESNPWRSAWKTEGLEVTTGDIIVPFGDANDIKIVDSQNVSSANFAALLPLTLRYGVSDIVILQAKISHNPDLQLDVVKRRINRVQNEVNLTTYRADPQETKELLLSRAAHDIAESLEHKKTEEMEVSKTVSGGERNNMMVLASISTLASWTQLRSKLAALPMVDKLEVLALSPQQVDMVIHYRGTPDSLSNAITSQNIRLVKNPNYWVISRD
jgi:hypothetical protein